MKVLGIETSCDETGLALYDSTEGILAEALHSQIALHRIYGGVVPELAARDHIQRIIPLLEEILATAQIQEHAIDAIAYTQGPGLIGALLVGGCTAHALAMGWDIPIIGVHHMEGHLMSVMLGQHTPSFPFIALLVSGGHTQLILVKQPGQYELLGESLDDAAGEAFDKVAMMLDLPYPGGPEIAQIACSGQPNRFIFPRPMTDRPSLDFSFSGLKTFTLNIVEKIKQSGPLSAQDQADIAYAFEDAVVDTLVIKCRRALKKQQIKHLVVAGGVGANTKLRTALTTMTQQQNASVYFPPTHLCTDNGVMIAYAGCCRLLTGQQQDRNLWNPLPRWELELLQ